MRQQEIKYEKNSSQFREEILALEKMKGNEEMKRENKRPLGLDIGLFFSAIFGLGMLMIGFTAFSFSLYYSSQYPILFIAQLALSLAGFLLILSVVGLWLQKKIAYWSMMFTWVVIMFSGLYINKLRY
ncbi:hypothetical protein DRN97_09455 [Methanosarcinales archaeon]|nr:MAG: hypothetical protein DRN97_09455 [Methanosarcinales archaeon]